METVGEALAALLVSALHVACTDGTKIPAAEAYPLSEMLSSDFVDAVTPYRQRYFRWNVWAKVVSTVLNITSVVQWTHYFNMLNTTPPTPSPSPVPSSVAETTPHAARQLSPVSSRVHAIALSEDRQDEIVHTHWQGYIDTHCRKRAESEYDNEETMCEEARCYMEFTHAIGYVAPPIREALLRKELAKDPSLTTTTASLTSSPYLSGCAVTLGAPVTSYEVNKAGAGGKTRDGQQTCVFTIANYDELAEEQGRSGYGATNHASDSSDAAGTTAVVYTHLNKVGVTISVTPTEGGFPAFFPVLLSLESEEEALCPYKSLSVMVRVELGDVTSVAGANGTDTAAPAAAAAAAASEGRMD